MNVNLAFMSGCLCKCVILDIFINVWEHTCHTQTIVGDRKARNVVGVSQRASKMFIGVQVSQRSPSLTRRKDYDRG